MSWTLLGPRATGLEPLKFPLPINGTAYIVSTLGCVRVVHELHSGIEQTELGRITVGPWGAKLEAINNPLAILSGQIHAGILSAATDPRLEKYQLQPRLGEHSEVLLLRHGDVISSSNFPTSLTCMWEAAPKVLVNSSAAEAGVQGRANGLVGVIETPPDEETEDEDFDHTTTAVKATQSKSQQPQATPRLSNQRSIVIQETPTAARTKDATEYSANLETEVDHEPLENSPILASINQVDAEAYSTAHTGHSQNITANLAETTEAQGLSDSLDVNASALIHTPVRAIDDQLEELPQKNRRPKVMISRKRPSPALDEPDSETEPVGRSSKRAKRNVPSDDDTQDIRLSNIVVDTSSANVPATKSRKRKSVVKDLDDVTEATPPRSQRSSQRSDTVPTTELYSGDIPRIATSNSSITDKSQAVKFLKKQGGSLVDSVKDPFNVLCVRDGDLHKTPKFLRAIATGTPIVTDKWLSDSAKAGKFLSVNAYKPSAPKQEKEWKFKLEDVFGQPQTPFEGYTIHFTTAAHAAYKIFTEIEQVCKAAGAEKVTKKKLDKSEKVIVLAMEEGDKEADKLMQDGVTCYIRDILPTSIFRGSLNLESDEFKIDAGASPGTGDVDASTAKETKTRRGRKT